MTNLLASLRKEGKIHVKKRLKLVARKIRANYERITSELRANYERKSFALDCKCLKIKNCVALKLLVITSVITSESLNGYK